MNKKSIFLCLIGIIIWPHILSAQSVAVGPPVLKNDELWKIYDNNDTTKRMEFEVSGITTDTTRTWTVPDYDVVANAFIDWTSDQGATNIHADNLSGNPVFGWIHSSQITPLRIVVCDGDNLLTAFPDMTYFFKGTANQIVTTSGGDGIVTFSTPQDIDATSIPEFAGVGIGTASPQSIVGIDSDGASQYFSATDLDGGTIPAIFMDGSYDSFLGYHDQAGMKLVSTRSSASNQGAGMILYSFDGAPMGSGHRLGWNIFGGSKSDTAYANAAGIVAYADGNWTSTSAPARLEFQVAPIGSTTRATALKLESDKTVYTVGVYDDSHGGGGRAMYIQSDGQLTCDTSSIKYKKNVRDLTLGDTDFIYNLRPRLADWKASGVRNDYTLIAEEVEQVNPKLVSYQIERISADPNTGQKDEIIITDIPEGVHYYKLIVPMLNEIQNLRAELDGLEKRVTKLENAGIVKDSSIIGNVYSFIPAAAILLFVSGVMVWIRRRVNG